MAITDSILETIKELLGIQTSELAFDVQLVVHINSVFMILNQLGVGPTDVYIIDETGNQTWAQFLPDGDDAYLSLVKSYMYLKVQSLFDPPTSGIVSGATQKTIEQFEYRLTTQVEIKDPVV